MDPEGVGVAFGLAVGLLGFPTSVPVTWILAYALENPVMIYYGMLLSIVANWAALLWLTSYRRDRRVRRAATADNT
jgi:hypothetical protein